MYKGIVQLLKKCAYSLSNRGGYIIRLVPHSYMSLKYKAKVRRLSGFT